MDKYQKFEVCYLCPIKFCSIIFFTWGINGWGISIFGSPAFKKHKRLHKLFQEQ